MDHEFLTFRYNLVDFKTIPYREFLQSDKPEEIILAILGNFKKRKTEEIGEQILRKINVLKIRNEIKLKSVKHKTSDWLKSTFLEIIIIHFKSLKNKRHKNLKNQLRQKFHLQFPQINLIFA
jgi:hypothetical protein